MGAEITTKALKTVKDAAFCFNLSYISDGVGIVSLSPSVKEINCQLKLHLASCVPVEHGSTAVLVLGRSYSCRVCLVIVCWISKQSSESPSQVRKLMSFCVWFPAFEEHAKMLMRLLTSCLLQVSPLTAVFILESQPSHNN